MEIPDNTVPDKLRLDTALASGSRSGHAGVSMGQWECEAKAEESGMGYVFTCASGSTYVSLPELMDFKLFGFGPFVW